jgi:hypothetical protein
MGKISVKGVVLGGLTDAVSTNLICLPILTFSMIPLLLAHASTATATAAIAEVMRTGPLHVVLTLLGCACSVLGGYVAASLAKHDELLNGALSSWLCLSIGIFTFRSATTAGSPLWEILLLEGAAPVAGLLGGYLRQLQKGAQNPAPVAA